jgi:hypothetical protein
MFTVERGCQGFAELFMQLASAFTTTLPLSKEFAMSVFNNIVCVGAALDAGLAGIPIAQVAYSHREHDFPPVIRA